MISNPPSQRELRTHRLPRPTLRAASSPEHLAQLAERLQPRDKWLARMLFEHQVLTSHQITQLAWSHHRVANHRLRQLYTWRVIDRFQPFLGVGSAPMHYVLDAAGATLLAYEDNLDPKTLHYRHDRAIGHAMSLQLAHTVGTNGVFTALIAHARTHPDTARLDAWWSAARCARHFGDIIRPDGYARWSEDSRDVEFFLEFDFGTETLQRLAGKLAGYHRLAATTGITTPILIWLPTHRREQHARTALYTATRRLDRPTSVPVATAHGEHTDTTDPAGPAGPRWLPLDAPPSAGRCRLIDLTSAWPWLRPPTAPADTDPSPAAPENQPRPPEPMPPQATIHRIRAR